MSTGRIFSFCPAKMISETIVPIKIAMPPNLGMALVCIRRASLGMSMAPIFGASLMATGVKAKDSRNAMPKAASRISLVISICSL